MTKTVTKNPTNQIKASITSDKTLYNGGKGWKDGYRLNSSGAEVALASYKVTGFIPAKFGDTLRFEGISSKAESNTKIAFYDSSFAILNVMENADVISFLTTGVYAVTDNLADRYLKKSIENMAYFRLSVSTISDASMVTVNEPLEASTTTTQGWYSTGHAFVPADYEGRIIDLEDRAASLENRVDELSVGTDGAFTYVAEEAKRVANIVQAKRTVGSLTFTAMSDPHIEVDTEITYGVKNNLTSCRDAGLGLAELQKHFKLDFTAMLGDYTWGDASETVAQVKKDLTYVKRCMTDGMKGIPNIWCTGNHDINYGASTDRRMTEDEMYAYLTSNNKGTIQDGDNIGRNYGYIDFENQKIRCIYLNTVDALDYPDNTGTADDALEIAAIQTKWLVDNALNLSEKSNANDWGIVILSHHCLCQFQHITAVLTAYKNGTNGSVNVTTDGVTTTVNYNFTSANRGEIICAIHGHDHNFTYRKISTERWDKVTEANAWLWSICVPNMDTTRNNEKATNTDEAYKNAFGEFDSNGNPVYYPKTQGTATSTSFCVITIDRKNRKIHAIAYGAGIDREISY
jgi:UDP-2,3-diacylglucosamine pyrophosphatase LpxH